MSTVRGTRRRSSDDLASMPQNRTATHHEIIDGEMIATPTPVSPHELPGIEPTCAFVGFVKAHRHGRVFGDHVDHVLSASEVVNPDVSFIAQDRVRIVGPKASHDAPGLAREILPSSRRRDSGVKPRLDARDGVCEDGIVDPAARRLPVFGPRPSHFAEPPRSGDRARSEVLPGVEIGATAVFAELDWLS